MEEEQDDADKDQDGSSTTSEASDDGVEKPEPDANGSIVPYADRKVRRQSEISLAHMVGSCWKVLRILVL